MKKALDLAFSRIGQTSPNPPVGAVIVRDGEIISSGGTCECGGDHAEIDAIKKSKGPLAGADMYVSLEPCCHYGKTPPCTEAIIKSGIARVVVAAVDPNPLVSGCGIQRLREAGVKTVMMTECQRQALELLGPFVKSITRGQTYILHKSALTLDGHTADAEGTSRWISSEYSRYIVHRLRSMVDAVIVGIRTIEYDNPSLTPRLGSFPDEVIDYFNLETRTVHGYGSFFLERLLNSSDICTERDPLRIVMGCAEGLSENLNVLKDDNYLFFEKAGRVHALEKSADPLILKLLQNRKVVFVEGDTEKDTVNNVLQQLASRGILSAMLEGGAATAGAFFDAGGIDEFLYFIAPRILGGGKPLIKSVGAARLAEAMSVYRCSSALVKDDLVYHAYGTP